MQRGWVILVSEKIKDSGESSDVSRIFLGKNGTYIKPTKVPPWLALSKIFVLSDALKMHSPNLPVLRFICETFSKLLKFALRNTSVRG